MWFIKQATRQNHLKPATTIQNHQIQHSHPKQVPNTQNQAKPFKTSQNHSKQPKTRKTIQYYPKPAKTTRNPTKASQHHAQTGKSSQNKPKLSTTTQNFAQKLITVTEHCKSSVKCCCSKLVFLLWCFSVRDWNNRFSNARQKSNAIKCLLDTLKIHRTSCLVIL